MTLNESFKYAFEQFTQYYSVTCDDKIGIMLAGFDTSFYRDGEPGDPATALDWERAVREVTGNREITEREARLAIIVLLKEYNDHHGFELSKPIEYFQHSI